MRLDIPFLLLIVAVACLAIGVVLGAARRSRKPVGRRDYRFATIDEALDGVAQRIEHLEGWNRSWRERAAEWKAEAATMHRELRNAHKGIRRLKRRNDRLEKELAFYKATYGEIKTTRRPFTGTSP